MKRFFLGLTCLLLLTSCKIIPGIETTTQTPGYSPSPIISMTPTYSPTVFTPTRTFTPTPTPTLTPTPKGYIEANTGISLSMPEGWEIDTDEADTLTIKNDDEGSAFIILRGFEGVSPDLPFKNQVNQILYYFRSLFKKVELQTTDEVTLGDGRHAPRAVLSAVTVTKGEQIETTLHVIMYQNEAITYYLLLFGPNVFIDQREVTLARMYGSVRTIKPRLYGIERSQAIVLVGENLKPEDLDPAMQTGSAADYSGQLFSGLVRLSPDLKIEPDLAESWSVSPDGRVYTFTLRENVKFQTGKLLTAQDVRFSWERATDSKTKSPTAKTYLGDIQGVKEKLNGTAKKISGLQVINDQTLVVKLDGAKPYLLAKLTYPVTFVVNEQNLKKEGEFWMFTPDTSGPFSLREFRENEALVLERNDAYHTPSNAKYIIYLLDRSGNELNYYETDDIDIAYLDISEATQVQEPDHDFHDELYTTSRMCTSMLLLNNTRPPMDDPKVREAFTRAIDRDRLVELLTKGTSLAAKTILPPGMPGFSQDLSIPLFDTDAARAALEASKYNGKLPQIVLTVSGYTGHEHPLVDAVIAMWRETLGVKVQVEYLDPDYFVEAARKKPGHVVSFNWCADYPDPENFLDTIFHSGSSFNVSSYTNPNIDQLLEEARIELDPVKRLDLYNQIEVQLLADFSVIPLLHSSEFVLVKPHIEGYILTPIEIPLLHLLTIQPDKP